MGRPGQRPGRGRGPRRPPRRGARPPGRPRRPHRGGGGGRSGGGAVVRVDRRAVRRRGRHVAGGPVFFRCEKIGPVCTLARLTQKLEIKRRAMRMQAGDISKSHCFNSNSPGGRLVLTKSLNAAIPRARSAQRRRSQPAFIIIMTMKLVSVCCHPIAAKRQLPRLRHFHHRNHRPARCGLSLTAYSLHKCCHLRDWRQWQLPVLHWQNRLLLQNCRADGAAQSTVLPSAMHVRYKIQLVLLNSAMQNSYHRKSHGGPNGKL